MAIDVPYRMGSILYEDGHTDRCKKTCGHRFGVRYRWPNAEGASKPKEEHNRFATELEAFARLMEVNEEKTRLKSGAPLENKTTPAIEYVTAHMLSRTNLAEGSRNRYGYLLTRHAMGLTFPIAEFHPARMREFVATLNRDGVGPSDVTTLISIMRKACEVAVADRLLDVNPTRGIETKRALRPVHPREVPTTEQTRSILKAANPLARAAILTAAGTGVRLGELLSIDRDCIGADRVLEIWRQWAQGNKWQEGLKSKALGEGRRIPLDDTVYDLLVERCAGSVGGFAFEKTYAFEANRLKNPTPHPERRGDVSDAVKLACLVAGVGAFTLHAWRHYYATQLFNAGIGIEEVAEYLGHESIDTTRQTYIKFLKPAHDRARTVVSGILADIV